MFVAGEMQVSFRNEIAIECMSCNNYLVKRFCCI